MVTMKVWCGDYETGLWGHGTLLPCKTGTTASSVLLVLAVCVALMQLRLARLLKQRHFRPTRRRYPADAISLWLSVGMLGLELAWIVFNSVRLTASFLVFDSVCLAVVWAFAAVLSYYRAAARITLRVRMLAWPAVLYFAWAVYTDSLMLAHHWGPGRKTSVALLITDALQLCAALVLGTADTATLQSGDEQEMLKQALLGTDVEAPPGKLARPWYSLIFAAMVYVWPEAPALQFQAAICVVAMALMRLLNLAAPILYRDIVNVLADTSAQTQPRHGEVARTFGFWEVFYPYIFYYLLVFFLQGGSGTGSTGLTQNIRKWLYIYISQDAYRRISLDLFSHVLDLDLKFHLQRKTGEIIRIMDRGTSSIQNLMSLVLFNIVPALFDIIAACIYLATALQPWIALIVFVTLSSYIPLTIALTEWRGQFRRDMNAYDNAKGAKVTDALLNYETVKYFSNEPLERANFAEAIDKYQKVEYKLLASLNGLNVIQSVIIFLGLSSGLVVCTNGVAKGTLSVGDAVLFITMMQQLYAPMNYFGSYYRNIQQQLIDLENSFALLSTWPSIQDKPLAKELQASGCEIIYDNVTFAYDNGPPVLRNVSFVCPGGQTLALVGATGSGKSTVLRLLFRFYAPQAGAILIDHQSIADVTQRSLRSIMAVVPQDSVLFNDTIMSNIRYGQPCATDEEVIEAAKAASIHDAIVDHFPQGYATIVGERGLRLSGGEKQRVAFARAILRNPSVLLLDEATSALDSLTEARIQGALHRLRASRTTVIVAHRLSTVADADIIVAMKDGAVAETGVHLDLVGAGGVYAEMWARQAEVPSASASHVNLVDEGASSTSIV